MNGSDLHHVLERQAPRAGPVEGRDGRLELRSVAADRAVNEVRDGEMTAVLFFQVEVHDAPDALVCLSAIISATPALFVRKTA